MTIITPSALECAVTTLLLFLFPPPPGFARSRLYEGVAFLKDVLESCFLGSEFNHLFLSSDRNFSSMIDESISKRGAFFCINYRATNPLENPLEKSISLSGWGGLSDLCVITPVAIKESSRSYKCVSHLVAQIGLFDNAFFPLHCS